MWSLHTEKWVNRTLFFLFYFCLVIKMLLFSLLGKVPAMLKYTENVQVLARRKVFPWLPRVPVRDMGGGSGGQERMKLWDFQGDFLLIVLCTTFLLLVLCFNLSHASSNSLPVPVKLNYFFSVFFSPYYVLSLQTSWKSAYCAYARQV